MSDHGFHMPPSPFGDKSSSHRAEQLASTLRKELDRVLARGLADPRVKGMITITGLTVSDDFKTADVSVSIVPEDAQELTMHGLRSAAGHIRNQVKKRIATKVMPRLEFALDTGLKHQRTVYELIAKASGELAETDPERETEAGEDANDSAANHDGSHGGEGSSDDDSSSKKGTW
ncbi:MAG: 30S ribosome-binding factor RbfA [Planctomycetota bacterium]